MSSSASRPDIRKFNTYKADELTLEQARQHRDALVHEMDSIVSFAQNYTKDEAMFPTLREKFIRCKKEERLYRKYTYQLFLSQPSNTYNNNSISMANNYHSSNNSNYNENKMNNNNENLQLPDIPDDGNKNNSVVDYHSAEEKKCELDANAYTHGTNQADNTKAKQHRLSPPRKALKTQNTQKTHKSRPYIDDQHNNKNGQKHTTSSDDQYKNVAYLLFTEWPHPINVGDLYPKYYNHFREPLELSNDNIIESNPLKWISKRENPYFALYGLDDTTYSKKWDEKYYFWEIVDILGFFNSYDRKHQEVLIREKIHKTFSGLHPEGLKSDQVEKLFRYCIGLQVNELSTKMCNDIHNYVFKKYRNENEDYIRLCKDEPSFPLRESWKVYSLSVKHQMICILTEQGTNKLSIKELGIEFKSKFGVALDMKSWWIQSNLDKLIDSDLFKREKMLKISEEGRRKHKAWIEWWDCNGPAAEKNNVKSPNQNQNQVVHNAEAHSLQSPNHNQKQKQSQSYNDVRKCEQNDYNHNYNQNQNQNEMNSENQYGHNRRPGHDPETLLYIRGFTQDMNIPQILSEIEQEYKIKFANFRPPAIRWYGNMATVAPIPVQTIEMATRLISQHPLRTKSMQKDNRLDVRKFETTGSRYNGHNGGNNKYGDHGYERNSNNNNYGGYGRNNGRNNYRQSDRNNYKWQGNQ